MILLLALPTFALDFPWECPTFAEPADAAPYRDADGGLDAAYDRLREAANAYYDPSCAWVETTTPTDFGAIVERVCEGVETTVTETVTTWEDSDGGATWSSETTTLTVDVPFGETWTSITLSYTSEVSTWTRAYSSTRTRDAAWIGAVDGLPDDGSFSVRRGSSGGSYAYAELRSDLTVTTPGCTLYWVRAIGEGYETETVRAPDEVDVVTWYDVRCDEPRVEGYLDEAPVGNVDPDTWSRDPADADADGFPVPCDCDDADPAVNVGAREIAGDGIDQDCDGADLVEDDIVDEPDSGAPHPDTGEPARDTGDEAPPPSADDAGCRGAAAFLAFLPLFGMRRRARSG